jgi:hypothetical protein
MAFEAAAEEPGAGFERRVLGAIEAAGRQRSGTARQATGRRLSRGNPSRLAMVLIAATVAAALGATAALAAGGAFGGAGTELLSAMGLRSAATSGQRVEAAVTDAGLTVRATAAYRDHYLVVVGVKIDGADNDHLRLWGPGEAQPTAATSSGQSLRLEGSGGSSGGQTLVLAAPDFSELTGDDITLTIRGITRCELHVGPNAPGGRAPTMCGWPGFEHTIAGTWAIRLHVPVQGSLAKDMAAPADGQLDGVRVAFHDVAGNGSYLFVKVDTTEVTPGALERALATVPADRRPTSDPLWLFVYDPSGKPVGTLLQNNDVPGGKGGPAGPLTGTYHWTYFFTIPGPGTYRLVVHGTGGDQLVRTIQVR